MELKDLIEKLRSRLIEFRLKEKSSVSYHINSVDIVISLVDYALTTTPVRAISKEEESWLQAGFYLDSLLGNSEWKDIVDMYYEIVTEIKKRNYFR